MKTASIKKSSTTSKNNHPAFAAMGKNRFFGQQAFFKGSTVQTKLSVGKPNDQFEKEADSVADKVVQRLENRTSLQPSIGRAPSISPLIQQKCSDCEKEEKLQKKDEEQERIKEKVQKKPIFESNIRLENEIQRKCCECEKEEKVQKKEEERGRIHQKVQKKSIFESNNRLENEIQRKCCECEKEEKVQAKSKGTESGAGTNIEVSLLKNKGNGSPMSPEVMRSMETSFRADFSNVRIHNNNSSTQLSKALNAQAFTHGNDIYFNTGKYNTNTTSGKHLLAHELTHVVQQGASGTKSFSNSSDTNIQRLCGDEHCSTIDPLTPDCPDSDAFLTNFDLATVRNSIFISSTNPLVIKRGWTGPAVELIQRLLLNLDCSSSERNGIRDEMRLGIYGNKTRAAVRKFQISHLDGNNLPLTPDGKVGPATLSAMDIVMGHPPVNPPLAAEGTGNCFGKAIHGPGEFRELNILKGQMPIQAPFFPAIQAWELSNFDIDRHFVKTEHRNFLRSKVVPAIHIQISKFSPSRPIIIKVIGEASTTASDNHNKGLSERRAQCLYETLIGLGISPSLILPISGEGEILARQRRIDRGLSPVDNVEDRTERKVTIALDVTPGGDTSCTTADKVRPSSRFIAKIACESPDTYFINIGDVSDLSNPTYREFAFVHGDLRTGCRYGLNVTPSDNLGVAVPRDLHLATKNPDDPTSYSDFQGLVLLRSLTTTALLTRVSPVGDIFNINIPGSWTTPSCGTDYQDLLGNMVPRGPVHCGHVPDPPQASSCEESTAPCSDTDKQQKATRFVGRLGRFSGDPTTILRKIPFLKNVMSVVDEILSLFGRQASVGGAFVTLASKGIAPAIRRNFAFVGAGLNTSGASIEGDIAYADEFTLENPKQLETSSSGIFLNGSDFEGGATLTIKGGTNHTDLGITGNGINKTITFKGIFCNSSSDRVSHGRLFPASGAECDTIFMIPTFERDCTDDKDGCPPSRKVEHGRKFRIRTGRATYSSLPVIGKQFADQIGGCGAALSFINIGTDTGNNQWIYRRFLFVGKNFNCPFEVNRGDFPLNLLVPRFLAIGDGDNEYAPSSFIGPSLLNSGRNLNITNIPSVDFILPGTYLPNAQSCTKAKSEGVTLPISAVECGPVPAPLHLTTPDPSDLDRCEDFKDTHSSVVLEILNLKMGLYDAMISSVISPPGLRYKNYRDLPRMVGRRIENGVFAGKASNGEPVITIVDFAVLRVRPDARLGYVVDIKILSDPCTYNKNGSPVLLREEGCREGFIKKGQDTTIFPVPTVTPVPVPDSVLV